MEYYKTVTEIDNILGQKITEERISDLFEIISRDKSYENYFFKKVNSVSLFFPLKQKGCFSPEKAPGSEPAKQKGLFSFPEWNVLPYLEWVSQQVKAPKNERYINELLAIITDVSNHKDASGQYIDNYRTWWFFVKILVNIPNEKIPFSIINLIPIWLDSQYDTTLQGAEITTKLLPKFLFGDPTKGDIQKAEKIILSITATKSIQLSEDRSKLLKKKKEIKLVVDAYWFEKVFEKYSKIIGEKCSDKLVKDLGKRIRTLLIRKEDGTYRSFYIEEHISSPLELLTYALKRILIAKAKADIEATEKILKDFLDDNYFYFPKMALYIIGKNIDKYSELFFKSLDRAVGEIIIEGFYFGDELKHILQNLKKLSNAQKIKLKNLIEKGPKYYLPEKDIEKYKILWKQKRYKALSSHTYFNKLYEEYKKITEIDTELAPGIGKVEIRWGPGSSPLTKERFSKMTNRKLAKFLSTFKTKDFWYGPSIDGLSNMLKEVVQENPNKFISDLLPFLNTGYLYIYDILLGIRDAWNNKKSIEWASLFDFIKQYIDRKEFWKELFEIDDTGWKANHRWVIGMIGELIQDGAKDDDWAFSEDNLPAAQEILFIIIDNLKDKYEEYNDDPITHALNSAFGKTLTALIYIALRIARLEEKKGEKKEVKWSSELKGKYEKALAGEVIDAYTLFGQYMPNLYYLDKPWVRQRIIEFNNIINEQLWSFFVIGYLFRREVYDDLYGLMREHYLKALSYSFKEKEAQEKLYQHIAIGYLRDFEDFSEKSLFGRIVKRAKYPQIEELIRFFWMQKDYLNELIAEDSEILSLDENEKFKNKIIEFWRQLFENYKDKESLSEDDKKILADLLKLAIFLPKINNENYKWIMLSVSYIYPDPASHFFIEYLDELKDRANKIESGKYVGKVFLKILDIFTPTYDFKHIKSIVEYLYDLGNNETINYANKICNIYGNWGEEFLRDIYEKFNE